MTREPRENGASGPLPSTTVAERGPAFECPAVLPVAVLSDRAASSTHVGAASLRICNAGAVRRATVRWLPCAKASGRHGVRSTAGVVRCAAERVGTAEKRRDTSLRCARIGTSRRGYRRLGVASGRAFSLRGRLGRNRDGSVFVDRYQHAAAVGAAQRADLLAKLFASSSRACSGLTTRSSAERLYRHADGIASTAQVPVGVACCPVAMRGVELARQFADVLDQVEDPLAFR